MASIEGQVPGDATSHPALARHASWLTCFEEKRRLYAGDPFFQRSWRTVCAMVERGAFPLDELWHVAAVLFKPDSVLRGNTIRGLELLKEAGAELLTARAVRISAETVTRLWRYQLRYYSDERIGFLQRLMPQTESLYVLVRMPPSAKPYPACVQVSAMKGVVPPSNRRAGDLRLALGAPQSALLSFVHTADEPADLLRELGLLFDEAARVGLLREGAGRANPAGVVSLAQALLARSPRSDLDCAAAVERVREAARAHVVAGAHSGSPGTLATGLDEALDRLAAGDSRHWPQVRGSLAAAGIDVDTIDDLTILAAMIPARRDAPQECFPSCEPRHWLENGPGTAGPPLTGP